MLALFRNPLLRLLGRLWWLPALTLVAAWGLGGEQGWRLGGLGVAAYLAAIAGMIGAAWAHGAYVARRERARRDLSRYRFLCPNCLRFGGFHFACGACGKGVEDFLVHTKGTYINDCPHCHKPLLSLEGIDGRGVQAHCEQCQGNCDRTVHHQHQVRVLATLLTADFISLCQIISAQERQRQDGIGCAYDDDDKRLTYLLNLNSLTDAARSLPRTHSLRELKSIWLNAAGDDMDVALEIGKTADRFDRQTRFDERPSFAKTLTVCVPQTTLGFQVKNKLETRFRAIKDEVEAADFVGREAKALASPKTQPVPLLAARPAIEPKTTPQVREELVETLTEKSK